MSSDMFVFDEPHFQHLGSNMLSPEISTNFFTDPLSTISDSSIDNFLQEISSDYHHNQNTTTTTPLGSQISADETQSLDQITQTLLSNSPPNHQMGTLSLSQQQEEQTHLPNLSNSYNLASGFSDYSVSDVKTEDFRLGFDSPTYNSSFSCSNSYGEGESLVKFMQRSYSSNSFEGKPGLWFHARFDSLLETQNFPAMGSPEIDSDFSGGQMRRVCSTGDLPEVPMKENVQQRISTCTSRGGFGEGNFIEEANFKVGKYSAEERKERIDRYRAKRTQRNFNKTIKYACRKTLADNRPRIHGRFARNDETGEISKPTSFHPYQEEDDFWLTIRGKRRTVSEPFWRYPLPVQANIFPFNISVAFSGKTS